LVRAGFEPNKKEAKIANRPTCAKIYGHNHVIAFAEV
jgi:hypothetical protein